MPCAGPEYAGMYLHARYFDPKLGLFLSPDPSNPDLRGVGTNRYAYGFGNPINGTDRSGLEWGACDDGSGDTCWHDDQTHYSDSMTIGGGGINAWNWTYISQLIARIKAQAAALAAYYAAQNARQNPGGGGGGGGGGPEKPTDPAAPASKSRLIEAFQAGTCAAARAFFAKVPFPDIFPGRGDFGVSLTVSGAVSRFFAAGEEGMTRIWAPGGNYATFTYSAAGATVGANDVSPLTGNIAIEVGVTRQVDWSSVTQGGAQFGGAAAAGLGGAFSLSRSDGGGAWGLSMGPAGGLTAGLTGARTETVLRDQGNVLKDMGCE
jgi:RHS repeat-associated protein